MSESSYGGSDRSVNYAKIADEDVLEATNSIQTGIFGVLYTVSKEKTPSVKFVIFKLALEWLQLMLLIVNPQSGFNGFVNRDNSGWYVVSFVSLNQFMADRGYTFFLVCLYIMVAGLAINVALCAYVAHSFQNNRFDAVWPIVMLRYYSLIFFQVLEVASISFFLMTLDCGYFSISHIGFNQQFNVYCWSMPHLLHAAVSAIALVVFVPMAMLFTMAEIDTNPITRNPLAMSHSLVEVMTVAIKTIMTCTSVFVTGIKWMAIVQCTFAFILVYLQLKWLPHTYTVVNMARSASFSSVWYSTVILLLLAFKPGVSTSDPQAVDGWNTSLTTALWAGIVPVGLAAAGICWLRIRHFTVYLVSQFLSAPLGTKPKLVYEFTDPRQVEVMIRCCRKWQPGWGGVEDEDLLDPAAVKTAEVIMKAGISQLPKHPYAIILYSSFLIDVLGSYQTGYNQLQDAKKTDPSFMERFSVFSREQEHTQKESGAAQNGENAVDLVSYVEFQRNHRLVVKVHKEALLTMRTFWKVLLSSKVRFTTLCLAIKKMDASVKQAERVYRQVLARHANSAKLLRLYSRFLFDVKNDPWASAKWLAESERLDQEEDANKDSEFNQFSLASLGTSLGAFADPLKLRVREDRAIIIINGACTIQMTQGVGELFGYTKPKELHGRSVSEIIPPPFADSHSGYVRTHVNTGRRVLLDRTTELVALRKDRSAFPISITVSHLSGVGEDSMFMGIIEPKPLDNLTACAWVLPTGIMAAASSSFIDWFGYKPTELMGSRLSTVLVDAGVIEGVMEDVKRQRPPPTPRDSKRDSQLVNRKKRRSSMVEYFSGSVQVGEEMTQDPEPVRAAPPTPMLPDRRGRVLVEVADDRVLEVEYRVQGDEVFIPNQVVRHKYADPVKVDITVRHRTAGAFQVYGLTFRRQEPEPMLLVSDRQGHVRYASQSLCKVLDCTLPQLQVENNVNAVDFILPEPFAQMHYQHRQEVTGPRPPHVLVPPHSCFAGASVCLKTIARSSVERSSMVPVRLAISFRELGPSDVTTSMVVSPVSMEQALNERRLKLTLDAFGNVLEVGNSPLALFGFEPQLLKGKDIGSFLDVFKQVAQEQAHARLATKGILATLAERSAIAPGTSWRVGMFSPVPLKPGMSGLGALAQAKMAQRMHAATMVIKISSQAAAAAEADEDEFNNAMWGELAESKQGSMSSARPEAALYPGSRGGEAPPDSAPAGEPAPGTPPGESSLDPVPPPFRSFRKIGAWSFGSKRSFNSRGDASLQYEVEVWRSDLICSVLEVDGHGKLIGGGLANPLCPPGLAVGVGLGSMAGPLSNLIPQMKDQTVQDLFAGKLGQPTGKKPKVVQQGSLKLKGGPGRMDNSRLTGQATLLTIPHMGDGGSVEVMVHAVWKMGSQTLSYVVMRPVRPQCGREDFADWIQTAAAPAQALSRTGSRIIRPGFQASSINQSALRAAEASIDPSRRASVAVAAALPPPSPKPATPPLLTMTPEPEPAALAAPEHRADETEDPDWVMGALAKLKQDEGSARPQASAQSVSFHDHSARTTGADVPEDGVPLDKLLHHLHKPSQGAAGIGAAAPEGQLEGRGALEDWLSEGSGERKGARGVDDQDLSETENQPDDDGDGVDDYDEDEDEDEDHGDDDQGDEEEDEEEDGVLVQRASIADQADDDADPAFTDYKRGKRFKTLLKFFTTAQVSQTMTNFKIYMVLLTGILFIAHIACFAAMLELLQGVQASVQDLYSSAMANRKVYEIAINVRAIDIAFENKTDPRQPGMDDVVELLVSSVDDLELVSRLFKPAHQGVYLGFKGFKRLPLQYGVRDLWDKPMINVTTFFDAEQGLVSNHTMMGLWDLGNVYQTKARNLWVAASTAINATNPKNVTVDISKVSFKSLADYHFILANGPNNLNYYYGVTLDNLMQVTVEASDSVNAVHLIIMAVEGVLLVLLTALFVWKATQNVSQVRYDMYSCFVQIPQGMIRTLAEKKISLDGEDDEEDQGMDILDVELAATLTTGNNREGKQTGFVGIRAPKRDTEGSRTRSGKSTQDAEPRNHNGVWDRLTGFLTLRAWQHPDGPGAWKKQLETSNRAAWWMVSPFFLWGLVVMIMNSVNFSMLKPMSEAISLLNIVCGVLLRHHTMFFFSMDYVASNSGIDAFTYQFAQHLAPQYRNSTRDRFAHEIDMFEREYQAMLFSGASVGVDTPHFTMSGTGIATTNNDAKSILYSGGTCLCEIQDDCQPKDSVYYALTMSGLDALLKEYFAHLRGLVLTKGDAASVAAPVYSYILTLGQADIEGGIVQLTAVYFNQLQKQYSNTKMLQIILLVFVAMIAVTLLVFMVLPFTQEVWVETRRIAELLAQLPPEINVEDIVSRTMMHVNKDVKKKPEPPAPQKSTTSTAKLLPDPPAAEVEGSDDFDADLKWAEPAAAAAQASSGTPRSASGKGLAV